MAISKFSALDRYDSAHASGGDSLNLMGAPLHAPLIANPSKRSGQFEEMVKAMLASAKEEAEKEHRRNRLRTRRTRYRRAIITYIDVLGFKNIIQDRMCAEVHHLLDRFRREFAPDRVESEYLTLRFVRFSDCLVRAVFVSDDKPDGPDGLVFWELYGLLLAQINLIFRGVVVRGAVTVGDLYYAPGTIFGPGLVRAYELEQIAKYPRILVDTNLFHELKAAPFRSREHSVLEEYDYIQKMLSADGKHIYLDYLKGIASNADNEKQLFDFIERHRDLVRAGLDTNKGNRKVTNKYLWMAKQHRMFVSGLPNQFVRRNGYRKGDLYV